MNRQSTFRRLLFGGACFLTATILQAKDSRTTYTFTIHRTVEQTTPTLCEIHPNVLKAKLGTDVAVGLANGNVRICAIQGKTGKVTRALTLPPNGHYFNNDGNVVVAAKGVVSSQFNGKNAFNVNTIDGMIKEGDKLFFQQVFIATNTNDTVVYAFDLTIDNQQSVVSNEPSVIHRPDKIDSWVARPYVRCNEQDPEYINCIQVNAGDKITFGFRPLNEGETIKFNIKGPDGKTLRTYSENDFTLSGAEPTDAGYYKATVRVTTADKKTISKIYDFIVDVQTNQGENWDWKEHTASWSYSFSDEHPDGFPAPTKTHTFTQHNGNKANRIDGEWWSVYWGDNLNKEVDANNKNAMTNMIKKFDEDFAYIRDVMGWPPDINARKGYKSFIYVFGSGINRDNTSSTEKGGYQSMTSPDNGGSWPCVWCSYYPVSRFRDDAKSRYNDVDYQCEAMIHEGIHATFADMDGVKQSAWFHEGGNVWLQMAMNSRRDGVYGAPGWLGVGNLICPFMPIECYSGWLQDGSFGGPSAEGVNMWNSNGQQVCTWRNLIGGVQYGEVFPLFLGEAVGYGAIPWIWRYCKTRVLEGIANGNSNENIEGIGDEAMRMLIMQYRAKLATLDFGGFSKGCRDLVNQHFLASVKPEWEPYWIDVEPFKLTPYQSCTINDTDGWMAPDTLTNPGWSGGNIIPIHVTGKSATVSFRPEDENMRAQLCYRTKDGRCFYSQPVTCGPMTLKWDDKDAPANGVIFCVPCNTDYIYAGEEMRKKHYDYRIKLGEGALAIAATDIRWYLYEQNLVDHEFETGVKNIFNENNFDIRIMSSTLRSGERFHLDFGKNDATEYEAHLVGVQGVVIDKQKVASDGTIQIPANLNKGMYILALQHKGKVQTFKVFVNK